MHETTHVHANQHRSSRHLLIESCQISHDCIILHACIVDPSIPPKHFISYIVLQTNTEALDIYRLFGSCQISHDCLHACIVNP